MSHPLDIRLSPSRRSCTSIYTYTFILLAQVFAGVRAGDGGDGEHKLGYKYGQSVPVSCLSRSIESGEHVTDQAGALHYTPFPTCNETSRPLSFRYGVSETVSCTIDPVSDPVYHLLEYYVHSDVPLTCRVPTLPLEREGSGDALGGVEGRAFTPLTVALQGTLQLSHLHVWSEMNVLMHRAGIAQKMDGEKTEKEKEKEKDKKEKKDKKKKWKDLKKQRGLVYAGTAYSLPSSSTERPMGEKDDAPLDAGDVENQSLDPWAAGQGAKVVRGEPLTFTFRVSWVHGEDVPEQTGYLSWEAKSKDSDGVLSSMFFFLVAAGFGAVLLLAWEKWVKNRRRSGYKGDGILGYSGPGKIVIGNSGFGGGKVNGYGGYGGGGTNGYGGYSSGKRD